MQIGSAIGTQGVGLATNVPLLNTINVSNDAFLFGYQSGHQHEGYGLHRH